MTREEWEAARIAAYHHPGLLCYKGELRHYPGYVDDKHVLAMMSVAGNVLDHMTRDEAWDREHGRTELFRDTYRSYIQYQRHVGLQRIDRRVEGELWHFEPLRERYEMSGKLALPLPLYYDASEQDLERMRRILPSHVLPSLEKLYAAYSPNLRRRMMRDAETAFAEWLSFQDAQTLDPYRYDLDCLVR